MQTVTIKKLPQSKIKFEITISPKDLKPFVEKAAKDYSRNNPLAGFRPGKASVDAVEKKIGKEDLAQKAQELAVEKYYLEILAKNKIQALEAPRITPKTDKKDKNFKFEAVVSVFPKIKLCDFKSLKFKKHNPSKVKVNSVEVDAAINQLRQMKAKLITVNRAAETKDRVEVNFKLLMNGIPMEGGSSLNHPIIIGENKFIPGFEEQLIGMKRDEKKNFKLTFPKDYYEKELQGKEGEFEVVMKLVQKQELPKVDDEFAKSNGKFSSATDFKKSIKENIKLEKNIRSANDSLNSLFEEIVKKSEVTIPTVLITGEKDKMFAELEENVKKMGLEIDAYLQQIKKTKKEIMEGWDKDAEKRIKIGLALRKIATDKKIKADTTEINKKIATITNELAEDPEKAKEINAKAIKTYAKNLVINEKVISWLKENILKVKQ